MYLFGFSRGAYTVRSLAGLIHTAGLVRRRHVDKVRDTYNLYRNNADAESREARMFRDRYGGRIGIKLVCCFDTVGALGVPESVFGVEMPKRWRKRYDFHHTEINENVENAIHCLSIDEDRNSKLFLSIVLLLGVILRSQGAAFAVRGLLSTCTSSSRTQMSWVPSWTMLI